jgi:hypothetical protein
VDDCDGAGTKYVDFVRQKVIPAMLTMGWLDVLIQNPETDAPLSAAEARDRGIVPRLFTIMPSKRNNWSCQSNDEYNFVTFEDKGNEPENPLAGPQNIPKSYLTLIAGGVVPDAPDDQSIWVRSFTQGTTPAATRRAGAAGAAGFTHRAGLVPTQRVPVASIYFRKSIDPDRRHWGVSKVATMAAITYAMIQLLSWMQEDIIANLALTYFPTKGGKKPVDDEGNPILQRFSAFTTLYVDMESKFMPGVLQGDVAHIAIKLQVIELYIREILRLAHLMLAEGSASVTSGGTGGQQASSGFHAVVNRTEFFKEVADISTALDSFTLDVFALVKSWATSKDVTKEEMLKADNAPKASFFKGPFTDMPLDQITLEVEGVIGMFRRVSPTLIDNQLRRVARAAVYQDDPDLDVIMQEIQDSKAQIEREQQGEIDARNAALQSLANPPAPPAETVPGNGAPA